MNEETQRAIKAVVEALRLAAEEMEKLAQAARKASEAWEDRGFDDAGK